MSRLKAFEGAIASIPESLNDYYVSSEFPTFGIDDSVADRRYVKHLCSWPSLWEKLQGESKGIGARRERVSAERLLAIRVPMPPLNEQRRIADKLDATLNRERAVRKAATSRAEVILSTINAIESKVYDRGLAAGWELRRLYDLAEVNPRTERPRAGAVVAFVPMSALNGATGVIDEEIRLDAADIGNGYKLFRRNDVIFARITPCMQNGKSAIFSDEECEHGYGSTEFHVIRPTDEFDGRWVHHFLRSYDFRNKAARHMTGTAGQQRLPATYLRDTWIPLPGTAEGREIALRRLDDLQATRMRFKALHMAQISDLKALSHSILEAAFSGRL